jgi:hypothetical protein
MLPKRGAKAATPVRNIPEVSMIATPHSVMSEMDRAFFLIQNSQILMQTLTYDEIRK